MRSIMRLISITNVYLNNSRSNSAKRAPDSVEDMADGSGRHEDDGGPAVSPVDHSKQVEISAKDAGCVADFVRKTMAVFGAEYGASDMVGCLLERLGLCSFPVIQPHAYTIKYTYDLLSFFKQSQPYRY